MATSPSEIPNFTKSGPDNYKALRPTLPCHFKGFGHCQHRLGVPTRLQIRSCEARKASLSGRYCSEGGVVGSPLPCASLKAFFDLVEPVVPDLEGHGITIEGLSSPIGTVALDVLKLGLGWLSLGL